MFTRHLVRGSLATLGALAVTVGVAGAVSVPAGTAVTVHVTSTISSSNAKAGQMFGIAASEPAVMGNRVFIRKGAGGQGEVVSATPAGKSGKQGTLTVKYLWIYGTDGSKIPLSAINAIQGKNKTGSSNAANIAGTLLLGPVGLFAHNFVKGHDIVVDPSKSLTAYVAKTLFIGTN